MLLCPNQVSRSVDFYATAYTTYLTGDEARKILAAHKVAGRSKLDADAARRMAHEQWPDDVRAAREAKAVRYRWLVAHGIGVSYTELAEIERRAGVEPLPSPGSRGAYASAEDVAKVYAVGAACREAAHAVCLCQARAFN